MSANTLNYNEEIKTNIETICKLSTNLYSMGKDMLMKKDIFNIYAKKIESFRPLSFNIY